MTGDSAIDIYPQYCFHLSPTIEKWCRFRAQQIHELRRPRDFEGQDLYFYLNHPIRWVQVAGVVVAIDEFPGRRIYTVDDSSGATIECVVNVPRQSADQPAIRTAENRGNLGGATTTVSRTAGAAAQDAAIKEYDKPVVDGEIDVGHILLVKGSIRIFRHMRQIQVYKIFHLRCTEDEVRFWKKMTEFHASVLSSPWVLSDKEVRRCRREATRPGEGVKERKRERRKVIETHGAEEGLKRILGKTTPASDATRAPKARVTGLERRTKRVSKPVWLEGKYSALGI